MEWKLEGVFPPMVQKAKPVARIAPAASGGPGTFHGCDYQIEYAILQSLNLIWKHLYEPLRSFSITLEARVVNSPGVTRWDIQTDPPLTVTEAKANLSRADLVEFLHRVRETSDLDATLALVYGRCSTPVLAAAIRLRGLAVECDLDHTKFDELVAREEIPNAATIMGALGSEYRERLPRLVFEDLPEKVLKRELEVRSRDLYPGHPSQLVDFLFKRFFEGATSRQRYEVSELVSEIERAGMVLTRPTEVELSELTQEAASVLALLQATHSGLPAVVVASATGTTTEQVQGMLSKFDLVSIDEDLWRIRPLPFHVPVENRTDLLRRGLEGLLDFLSSHETDKKAEGQLRNAMTLARECLGAHPGLALNLFQATEHIVKNLGDKHLLLEISDICIHAGQQSGGGDAERRAYARAQAMLCGTSWVWQRTGRLDEARVAAEKSLDLGERIGWDRNTAFAKKCIGRLDRVEAEQPGTSVERRAELLQASAQKLREAIVMFSNSGEFGPTHRQVGDCHSLLARTYLTARMRYETETALRAAYDILPSSSTKEYFDLLILNGDYEVMWGSREEADVRYTEVINHHLQESREHSEIYARALSKRAANRVMLDRKKTAFLDYQQSEAVWQSLDEHEEAAKMEWARLELEGKFETGTLQLFKVEPFALVRLSAFRAYIEQLEGTRALAHRSRPTPAHVEQYLKDARKRIAFDYPEW
jgi:tetratricopeptide (TPR) repeat protein